MKKIQSIGFKLILGGILVVLIPILVIGSICVTKTSNALTSLSENQVQNVAVDLARLVNQIISADILMAKTFAAKHQVIKVATLKEHGDKKELSVAISDILKNLKNTYDQIGNDYEGFFITDSRGNIITGVSNAGNYTGINVAERDYFKKMINTKQTSLGDMIHSKASGNIVCVICSPIKSDSGAFTGSFCLVVEATHFAELVSSRKIGTTGYGFMTNKDGTVMAHPVEKHILSLNMFQLKGLEVFSKKMLSGNTGVEKYTFNGIKKIAGYAPVGLNNWYVAATQDTDEFLAAVNSIRNTILLIGIISILITLFMFILLSRTIVRPLNAAVKGLKDIAQGEGDLTMRLSDVSHDEVGELAKWFNLFIEKLQNIIKQIRENSQFVNQSSTELTAIAAHMFSASENTANQAGSVAAATEEMSVNLNSVAAAMEESSTNTTMVAAAAEQMSSTINEIARNAEKARDISLKAVTKSRSASERMSELGKITGVIGKVTETITDISEQTNLLALNATIEAARAGAAGKGFAVVANEIKELALQTAKATLDIRGQIEAVQSSTSLSIAEIGEISDIINSINEIVNTIAAAVEEQSTATDEIATNINQASQGIQDVNENINETSTVATGITKDIAQVNSEAGELSRGSDQIRKSAESLNVMSVELTGLVKKFKV